MKILENYYIHVLSDNVLLRKAIPYFIRALGGGNIHFSEHLHQLMQNMRQIEDKKSIIFIDTPFNFKDLAIYSGCLDCIPIFMMQDIKDQRSLTMHQCLKTLKESKGMMNFQEDGFNFDAFELFSHENLKDNNSELYRIPYYKSDLLEADLQRMNNLNLRIYSIIKPFTIHNLSRSILHILSEEEKVKHFIPITKHIKFSGAVLR